MPAQTRSQIARFIWNICNLLRAFGKATPKKLFQDRKAFLTELRTLDRECERDVRLSAQELKAAPAGSHRDRHQAPRRRQHAIAR